MGREPKSRPANSKRQKQSGLRNGLSIGALGFLVAIVFGGPLGAILQKVDILTGTLILAGVIGLSILSDIIAIAATSGREEPFNAMASNRVSGAREALVIVRNAGKVNSVCADVIGDISGTISGVVATPIILSMKAIYPDLSISVIGMMVLGTIAFVTIGGKAAEKAFAVKASTSVILLVGKCIYYFKVIARVGRGRKRKGPNVSKRNG